ncbi:hypothetical protein Tco_1096433, partial [Tanacetum coccineum]
EIDDPDITIEEYVQLETERALRKSKEYNWETATYGKIWDDEDVHYLRLFETEFPVIVYNDAWESKSGFSSEPTVSPQHVDEVDLKDETSLSEYDEEEYNARILELKRRNFKVYCSDTQYAVSNKEAIAYMCLDFTSNHEDLMTSTPYSRRSIRRMLVAVEEYSRRYLSWSPLQETLIRRAWSDSKDGDEPQNDATCLMAIESQEVQTKPSISNDDLNINDLKIENEELLKFNKDFAKMFEKLLNEKRSLESENSKLLSKINDLEIDVKKLTKNQEVVEPCKNYDVLTKEVDSLKCSVSKLQDEALNFSN